MRKDIFKKIGLISKSGFLASSLINIEAMNGTNKIINESKTNNENKIINGGKIINKNEIINENEIKTLEQILKLKNKKNLSNDTFNIIDDLFNDLDSAPTSPYKIINKKDFLELINKKNKEDILFPIKLGNEARKNAYDLAKNLREYIYKKEEELGIKNNKDYIGYDIYYYYVLLICYFINKDKDIDPKDTDLGKFYDPIIKRFKSENINNEIFKTNKDFDCSKLILIHPDKFYNNQIHNIGRNVLHEITKDIYNENLYGEDKGSSELKRLFNGEMNCTCNTFMLYTFLRLNKILCYTYAKYGHEFVLIPLKDEENKAINFYKVDLQEGITINIMKFLFNDIIEISKNDYIWFGMIKSYKKRKADKYFMFNNGFTPTYIYYKSLDNFIDDINCKIKKEKYEFENINNDIELIKYYLNGLKNAWQFINEKYNVEQNIYTVKFLPIEKGNCLFLPNVLDLGEPKLVELNDETSIYKKIMFNSIKKPGKYVNLMYADINISDVDKKNLEDVKLKINNIDFESYEIEYSISYDGNNIFKTIKKSNIQNAIRGTIK